MNILLTGTTGFIGNLLIPKLHNLGHSVSGIGRKSNRHNEISYYKGDIARDEVLSQINTPIDVIIHAAANVHYSSGADCFTDNVYGTYVISKWAETNNIKRVIYLSTSGIYDNSQTQVDESSTITPSSAYAMTKYLGEEILLASNVPAVILRITYLYGKTDNKSTVANIIESISNKQPIRIRNEKRDLLHVSDAINAILSSITYQGDKRIFNIGANKLYSLETIAKYVMQETGNEVPVTVKGSRENFEVNSNLAREELKWQPKINLESGIKEIVGNKSYA